MSLNNAGTIGGTTSITFHEGDDVEVSIERFDMAMRCGDVKEKKWTMKLCSLSLDAYKRVKNELFPEELEGITYVRVWETLVKIFRKSTNIYKCRYEFNQVKKAEGEDVDGFINRLKEAARKCKFEAGELQSRMLDRLVAGINSPMLVERLLNEPKLTYETAAEICWTYEVARNTQLSDSYVNVVNEVNNNYKSGVGLKCFCCGKTGHFKRECKFKNASCFKCGKKGHLREMCRSKRQRERKMTLKFLKSVALKTTLPYLTTTFQTYRGLEVKATCVVTFKDRMTVEEAVTVSLWLVRLHTVLDMSIKCWSPVNVLFVIVKRS